MTDDAVPTPGVAFLLTQLGTRAQTRFAERVAERDLTPPQCGVLRLLRTHAGLSQQELAGILGMLPSSVVQLVDGLEDAGLVTRTRSDTDRRRYELSLTGAGERTLRTIARIGAAHEDEICAPLSARERTQLRTLLQRLADAQGLTPGVHPGYRTLREQPRPRRTG